MAHVVSLSYRKRFLYNRAYTTRTQIVLFALFKGPKLQQICFGICSRINASYSTRHLTMVNHMKFHHMISYKSVFKLLTGHGKIANLDISHFKGQ